MINCTSKLHYWFLVNRKNLICTSLWLILQCGLFAYGYYELVTSPFFGTAREQLSTMSLATARASAFVLNFDVSFIMLTMCRCSITFVRSSFLSKIIPFDDSMNGHIFIGWSIVFFSTVHVAAHWFNFLNANISAGANPLLLSVATGAGATGQVMCVALLLIIVTSVASSRRKSFDIFFWTHFLSFLFILMLGIHGAFCFLKADGPTKCKGPRFWMFWVGPGALYLLERLYREFRAQRETIISKVILHPSKVIEIQFKKPSFSSKAGQYVCLRCPEISKFQSHPFTLTSAPEEDHVSVHIRVVGDWTEALANRLGVEFINGLESCTQTRYRSLPLIRIDGPYGSASEDVFKHEVVVLVGAGIGQTPFASLLKSIWYRVTHPNSNMKLKKIYFIGICRDTEAFEWFHDILKALEDEDHEKILDMRYHLTGALPKRQVQSIFLNDIAGYSDAITGLRSPTRFGRPDFYQILPSIKKFHPNTKIGVFFCGPKMLGDSLNIACHKVSDRMIKGTQFIYHQEEF